MDLQFDCIKPPRPDSAVARPDTPPIHFVAGGEITPTELRKIRARMRNRMKMNIQALTSSPHPFITTSLYLLNPSSPS
jgi:hypothetical protein